MSEINFGILRRESLAKASEKAPHDFNAPSLNYKEMNEDRLRNEFLSDKPTREALAYYYMGLTEYEERLNPPYVIHDFLTTHPSAYDFAMFARDFVQGKAKAQNPNRVPEYTKSLNVLGAKLYGEQWIALEKNLVKERSGILLKLDAIASLLSRRRAEKKTIAEATNEAQAYAQSMQFAKQGRLSSQILSGFFDGGREAEFIGTLFIPTEREVILVDERVDSKLQDMRRRAKRLKEVSMSQSDKLLAIAQLIDEEASTSGSDQDRIQSWIQKGEKLQEIPLGYYFRSNAIGAKGKPMCRHYAKMLHILAKDAGLESTLVKGFHKGSHGDKEIGHEWTEITIDDQLYIGDIAYLAHDPVTRFGVEKLTMYGINPIMAEKIQIPQDSEKSNDRGKYYFKGELLYSVEDKSGS